MGQREPKRYERLGTHLHLSNGYEKIIIIIFKLVIPLLPNSLHSGRAKLGHRKNWSWEKRSPRSRRLRSQPCVQLSNGYPNMISYLQMKNFLFKNHLHSRFARINIKKIRIWSKWTEECLNVARAQEPTYISQMGIKKLFCIFKLIIPILPNSLHSGLVKLGHRRTRSWEKRGPKTTRLRSQSRGPRLQLSNG